MQHVITKAETKRNAQYFTAWYQAIPLMLNYWIGGNSKFVIKIMQRIPMEEMTAFWRQGKTSREIARTIADLTDQFRTDECQRRMID